MLPFLNFVHARFGYALLAFAVILGILGAFQFLSRRQLSGGFRSGFLLLWGLTVLQGLIGTGAFIGGARPREILHLVYGIFALLFLPGVYVYAGGRRKDTEAMLLTIACWVVAIAYGRGIMTGA